MSSDPGAVPQRHVVSRPWGAVVVRSETGGPEIVYHGANRWVASYAARTQSSRRPWIRSWEEAVVTFGPAVAIMLFGSHFFPFLLTALIVVSTSIAAVFGLRALAARACTARRLVRGKAIRRLITSGNDDLISAAIGPVIALDKDPQNAAHLVAELDEAWTAAQRSTASGKSAIIEALREAAQHFPTTDDGVRQVRQELAGLARSLSALDKAQRALDASTSTADLADPPEPPESLGLLRAASQATLEDAQVLLEVAEEQRTRRRGDQP